MHYQRGNNNKWLFLFFLFFSLALVCAWRGGRRGGGRGRDRRSPPVDVGGGWKVYGQHPIQRGTHQEKIFFELSADDVSKFQISVSPSSITIRTTTTTITTYIYICFYANSTLL